MLNMTVMFQYQLHFNCVLLIDIFYFTVKYVFYNLALCVFLGCILCIRYSLLLQIITASVCLSICLWCGSTRLYCAKMAEKMEILFAMNTSGLRNIVLDGSTNPPQWNGGELEKILPVVEPLDISGMAETSNFIGMLRDGVATKKYAKVHQRVLAYTLTTWGDCL